MTGQAKQPLTVDQFSVQVRLELARAEALERKTKHQWDEARAKTESLRITIETLERFQNEPDDTPDSAAESQGGQG